MSNGKPKPTFYLAVLILVVGLVALALWRFGALPGMGEGGRFSDDEMQQLTEAEAPDSDGITTVKEYDLRRRQPAPRGPGDLQLSGARGPDGSLRHQRLGGMGTHHLCQRRLTGRKDLEERREARISKSSWSSSTIRWPCATPMRRETSISAGRLSIWFPCFSRVCAGTPG